MKVGRRVVAALGSVAVATAGLVGIAAPAQAVETISLVPGSYTPGQPWTIRVDGVPTMTEGNIYIFWLTFENLRGNRTNASPSAYGNATVGEQTGAQCTAQTGVTFTLQSGPGNPAPNGGILGGVQPVDGCSWVGERFRFAYSQATGLGNSSVIDVTFPAGTFTLPSLGGYAVHFTAGATRQYDLDRECVGACPVSVTVPLVAQGGTCSAGSLAGWEGSTRTAPGVSACRRAGYVLGGFTTGPNETGDRIALGAQFVLQAGMSLYASWLRLPGVPPRPVVTPAFGGVLVTFRPPAVTGGPVTGYQVRLQNGTVCNAAPTARTCIVRVDNRVNASYRANVRALNAAGAGPRSLWSDPAYPMFLDTEVTGKRTKVTGLPGRGSSVAVSGQVLLRSGEIPPGTTVRPYFCIAKGQNCTRSSEFVAGIGRAEVNSKGRYNFERRFAREFNRYTVLVKMSGDGVTFTDTVQLGGVA